MKKLEPLRFRPRGVPPRQPLRTLQEMAEEFGVRPRALVALIANRGGPRPKLQHDNPRFHQSTWYDPVALRAWWKTAAPGKR